jgi:hypothetical protein
MVDQQMRNAAQSARADQPMQEISERSNWAAIIPP